MTGGPSRVLCLLAVPSHLLPAELCDFLGDHLPHVIHMRLLRDERPGRFMAAIEMDSQAAADAAFRDRNGAPFNSLET